MIETLASRVIFLSFNIRNTVLNADIKQKIDDYFDAGDHASFLSFLTVSRLEKPEYLALLIALKDRILSGDIRNPDTIHKTIHRYWLYQYLTGVLGFLACIVQSRYAGLSVIP